MFGLRLVIGISKEKLTIQFSHNHSAFVNSWKAYKAKYKYFSIRFLTLVKRALLTQKINTEYRFVHLLGKKRRISMWSTSSYILLSITITWLKISLVFLKIHFSGSCISTWGRKEFRKQIKNRVLSFLNFYFPTSNFYSYSVN